MFSGSLPPSGGVNRDQTVRFGASAFEFVPEIIRPAAQSRRRHPLYREGAPARHPQPLPPQGPALFGLSRSARPLRRRRPGGQALPGRELHHYHSGFEIEPREGPFDPNDAERGVDTLIKSLLDNGISPNANVYAELGSTWRFVMRDPSTAALLLGTAQACGRGQRAPGLRFDLDRLAAQPDPERSAASRLRAS